MIKIIRGVYGHQINGRVVPKDEKSAPFELTPEQEARLVGLGVAEYVEESASPIGFDEQPEEIDETVAHFDPEQLQELTNAKLKELAEDMGLETGKLKTKAQLIEAITAVDVELGTDEDDGDEPPAFDPTEAVE